MTVNSGEDEYAPYRRDRDAEEKLLDRFRDPADPLKILIVTVEAAHRLRRADPAGDVPRQAAARPHAAAGDLPHEPALRRGEDARPDRRLPRHLRRRRAGAAVRRGGRHARSSRTSTSSIGKLPEAVQKCLAYFPGVDRTVQGYEGLIAAQECLPNNDTRDPFAADFSVPGAPLGGHLARSGPERSTRPTTAGSRRSTSRSSRRPARASCSGTRSAPKTIELIHENVHVDAVRDDLETLVLDADLLEAVLGDARSRQEGQGDRDQDRRAACASTPADPRFKALGERLEDLKDRHEQGLLRQRRVPEGAARPRPGRRRSRARDAEPRRTRTAARPRSPSSSRRPRTATRRSSSSASSTTSTRSSAHVRFDGWQNTHAGEREVKMALRKTLFKYKLHQDQELFDRAYGYIRAVLLRPDETLLSNICDIFFRGRVYKP